MEEFWPLKEEVEDDIPTYTKLTMAHRRRWCCNRFLRGFYPVMRLLYVGIWFYYIPFLATTVNFSIPFLAEKLGGVLVEPEVGTMSAEYEAFLS